ncbi:hypothetical protein SUDANB6_03210 [Streptomyces sp. enrichment culture]|uniref:DUF397 domain-containing protein n=1 Tax=Streptomyces sp. enrichment culture TaxID=1795815 RepID=UPI003F551B01
MTSTPGLTTAVWRKSSHSDGGANNCVEAAGDCPGVVPVRDSKLPAGPVIVFGAGSWSSFLAGVRD